jgi:hypothetical protein
MKQRGEVEGPNCPCLTPQVSGRHGRFPVPVYCRLLNGRVRVPTPEQLASLCTAGQHHSCPGYRRWAQARAGVGRTS